MNSLGEEKEALLANVESALLPIVDSERMLAWLKKGLSLPCIESVSMVGFRIERMLSGRVVGLMIESTCLIGIGLVKMLSVVDPLKELID